MAIFRDLILQVSQLPSGSTLLEHLQSIGENPTILLGNAATTRVIKATSGTSRKNYTSKGLPQVHITDNSVQAIQQAVDELVRNIGRATS
jgi:hypothetical protein